MDITLFEKVDKTKLKEVLQCNNIPFENGDDKKWKDSFLKTLSFYNKKKYSEKGIETKYQQSNKYGRYYTKYGLQTFQREVRKYISGEFYHDLDFVNCHPVFLNKLLKSNNSKLCSTEFVKNDEFHYFKNTLIEKHTWKRINLQN